MNRKDIIEYLIGVALGIGFWLSVASLVLVIGRLI